MPGSGPSVDRSTVVLDTKLSDRLFEVVQRVEPLVHAGEAQVGDLVELPKRRQDGQTDVVGLDLRRSRRTDRLLDLLCEHRQVRVRDRSPLAGLAYAEHDLLATERLRDTAALDHAEARRLSGAEAAAAFGALPAAPDGESIVARTGI